MFGSFDPQAARRTQEFLQRARRITLQRRQDATIFRERVIVLRQLTEERLQRSRQALDRSCDRNGEDPAAPDDTQA